MNPYHHSRSEMVDFVPLAASRVLDVGCANGGFGRELRRLRPETQVWGIDPKPGADASGYEEVREGSFPDDLSVEMKFDCIVLNDVVEHVADPWELLRRARGHLSEGGVVVASIPNVRNFRVVVPLILQDRWTYSDAGILDRTHLRFFTRSAIRDLLTSTGFEIDRLEGIRLPTSGKRGLIRGLTKRLDPFLVEQYGVLARPIGQVADV